MLQILVVAARSNQTFADYATSFRRFVARLFIPRGHTSTAAALIVSAEGEPRARDSETTGHVYGPLCRGSRWADSPALCGG